MKKSHEKIQEDKEKNEAWKNHTDAKAKEEEKEKPKEDEHKEEDKKPEGSDQSTTQK